MQKKLAEELTVMVHSREEYDMAVEASGILFGKGTTESLKSIREDVFLSVFEGVPQFEIPSLDIDQDVLELLAVETGVFSSKGGGQTHGSRRRSQHQQAEVIWSRPAYYQKRFHQ